MLHYSAPNILFQNDCHILFVHLDASNIAMMAQSELTQTQTVQIFFSLGYFIKSASVVTGVP